MVDPIKSLRSEVCEANKRLGCFISDKLDNLQPHIMTTRSLMQWLCDQQVHPKQSIQEGERWSETQYQQIIDWIQTLQKGQKEMKERLAAVTRKCGEKLNDTERQREDLLLQTVPNQHQTVRGKTSD